VRFNRNEGIEIMKKKLKLKKGVKLGIFIVLCIYFLVCLFLYIKIDLETKREIQTIRNEYNTHISEIMPDETNYTQEEQTFVYEPKKAVKIDVCNNSSTKTYMDYRAITNKKSKQYQFIQANMTADERGYLIDNEGYIGVALGSYFGNIGTRYIFKLSSGTELKVVKVEVKDDDHTNNGCEQKWDGSVIEFVIDTQKAKNYYGIASNGYINSGNFNKVFNGKIIEIEKVVN
jgi:hypothetical protein